MALIKDLLIRIRGDSKQFQKETQKAEGTLGKFGKTVKGIGAAAAAAFSVGAITKFIGQATKLASEAEGVKTAFDQLNRPGLLSELQKATRGTVTEVELMRQAIRASNFKVPLEKLASFFEFATKRAIQTGESVDYLVNSIIDGIGRKSTLVMDNLGISATELQEEIGKVGDFGIAAGNIIERELGKMGDVADTTKTEVEQLKTSFENLKTELGERLAPVLGTVAEKLRGFLDMLAGGPTRTADEFVSVVEAAAKSKKSIGEQNDEYFKQIEVLRRLIPRYNDLKDEQEQVTKGLRRWFVSNRKFQEATDNVKYWESSITAAREAIDILFEKINENNRSIGDGTDKVEEQVTTFGDLIEKLKNLKDQTAGLTESEMSRHNQAIKNLEDEIERWKNLGLVVDRVVEKIDKMPAIGSAEKSGMRGAGTRGITVTGGSGATSAGAGLADSSMEIKGEFDQAAHDAREMNDQLDAMAEKLARNQYAFQSLGNAIGAALGEGIKQGEDFEKTMTNVARQVISTFIAEGVAAIIKNTLEGPTGALGPLAIPIAAAAGGLAAGLFNSLVPSFAEGGYVSKPTLAMVGDNPSGRGEYIIPYEKMNMGGTLKTKVSGRDLWIILDRENQFRDRT
nr:hypothetical protein 1 [bacterium]